jgi:hypothetical protein
LGVQTGRALLHDAAVKGHVEIVKMLIDTFKANVNITTTLVRQSPQRLSRHKG